jgi:hypothetical protein
LITLSARNSIDCGIVTPICFAVFKLITNSNLAWRAELDGCLPIA